MDDFETLADAENRPVNIMLVLLLFHVVPYALRRAIEKGLFTSLHVDEWCCTTSEEHTVD